ncbi:hypothetical protein LXT21_07520 [Myxococcus sp. K38C18041901]|uniref:hypothetical protein n=1 Tax=Myxococcus guangdongensis TaxID=2906760 RepID=UPI0020A7C071|nr:hypothetical protein [Myxococcus guangdongensis]MCP3058617.1 hypothetical protein [Myxococcus guangdongensis]
MARTHTQALAFGETEDTLYLLVTEAKKYRVVELRQGERTRDFSVPSGMWLMTSFVSPEQGLTLVLASRSGKTHVVVPGKRGKTVEIPTVGNGPLSGDYRGYVGELVTVAQRPCLAGMGNQFYAWDGSAWRDERGSLRIGREILTGIKAVVPMGMAPAVATRGEVHVLESGEWRRLPFTFDEEVKALAYRESDGTLFAAGNTLWRVTDGKDCQPVALTTKAAWWDAAVLGEQLYLSDLKSVFRVEGDTVVEVLPPGASVNHNHAMHVRGGTLHVVREDGVHRFDGARWTLIPSPELGG